jgi:hypothetical protein
MDPYGYWNAFHPLAISYSRLNQDIFGLEYRDTTEPNDFDCHIDDSVF